MLLKSLLLVTTIVFTIHISFAQNQVGKNIADHLLIKSADKDRYGDPEKETVGSPYLNDVFANGTVYSLNKTFTDVPMRYNIYNDYIEFKQNNQIYILDPEPSVRKVSFENKTFVVLKHVYRGKPAHGFLELLDSGKVILLAKKTIQFREWQPAKALESTPTPAKYTKTGDVYYYKIGDGEVLRIESLKKLIETFPGKQSELTQYAKEEKLGIKDPVDIKKLFKYYSSL